MRTAYKNDAYHDLFVFDAFDTIASFISIGCNDIITIVATLNGTAMYTDLDNNVDKGMRFGFS